MVQSFFKLLNRLVKKRKKKAFREFKKFDCVSIDEMEHKLKTVSIQKSGSRSISRPPSQKYNSILKTPNHKNLKEGNVFYLKNMNRKETSQASKDLKTPYSSIQDLSNFLPNRFNSPNVLGRGMTMDPSISSRMVVPSSSPYILKGPDQPQKLKEKPTLRRQGSTRSIIGSNFN